MCRLEQSISAWELNGVSNSSWWGMLGELVRTTHVETYISLQRLVSGQVSSAQRLSSRTMT